VFSTRVGGPTGRRRTSRRTAWIAVSIVALVALSVVSAAGAARPSPVKAPGAGHFTPVIAPLGISNQPQTVIVQLAGDPVTVADANAPAPFTQGEWNSHRDQLKSQQAPVASQIRSLGGQVLGQYQLAYNGIKVRIAGNRADSLNTLPGVVAVYPVQVVKPDNVHGVPLVGGPDVWGGSPSFAGEHIKIADIDTGIDYTHADFGGSGNPLDYTTARASDTLAANPAWFGPGAPKVKGGIDLVGDDYNADPNSTAYQPIPHQDPNPLDCNGHGTHTAGTAAGFGVLSNGHTFTGPYNATTVSSHSWNVGPGAAPKADIYAVRVFGCDGSTDVVVDAIEWAVANNMDVINMSLGSSFGTPDSPDAVASTNAARDGVIVIASSGNSGPNAYMTGTPASSPGALSVAASDPTQTFPGATLSLTKADLSSGGSLTAIVANGFSPLPPGPFSLKVIFSAPGTISQGCSAAADGGANSLPPNTFIVVARGTCARVAKAIFGQQAGAAGVIMVNNSPDFPPYEGKITNDPDAAGPPLFGGFDYTVTIPFLGVPGGSPPSASPAAVQLIAANGGKVSEVATTLSNPGYLGLASFSSWGPASGDSSMKPNVTAPGVSIASAGMKTGTEAVIESGTSMAAPHTTGVAALVKQAHPDWGKVKYWEAAISNTADPGMVNGYTTRGAGTGFIQAVPATKTQVVALGSMGRGGGDDDDNHEGGRHGGNAQTSALSFGFNELDRDYSQSATIQLRNFSNSTQTFTVADALDQGSPHTLSIGDTTITVRPRNTTDVHVRLSVPLSTAGGASLPGFSPFSDVAGLVVLTPSGGSNNGVTLRVPYYMVPQGVSSVSTKDIDTRQLRQTGSTTAKTTNRGRVTGTADWYAWGIKDSRTKALGSNDIRAVGASSFPSDGYMQFAISTYHRWSNAVQNEFDIFIDVNGDGSPDYDLVMADLGALQTGSFDGRAVSAVFDLNEGGGSIQYVADAPTDSNTLVVAVDLAALTDSNPATSLGGTVNKRITYYVTGFGLTDNTSDTTTSKAVFNPFTPAVSTGMFDTLSPGASASEPLTVNSSELLLSPALGWLVISHENPSGSGEAQQISLR
jgi:minor extracellular serine protease Vpr